MAQLAALSTPPHQRPPIDEYFITNSRADRDNAKFIVRRAQVSVARRGHVIHDLDAGIWPSVGECLAQRIGRAVPSAPDCRSSQHISIGSNWARKSDVDCGNWCPLSHFVSQPRHVVQQSLKQLVERCVRKIEVIGSLRE